MLCCLSSSKICARSASSEQLLCSDEESGEASTHTHAYIIECSDRIPKRVKLRVQVCIFQTKHTLILSTMWQSKHIDSKRDVKRDTLCLFYAQFIMTRVVYLC